MTKRTDGWSRLEQYLFGEIATALDLDRETEVRISGGETLQSAYPVSALAAAAIAAAGSAVALLVAEDGRRPVVSVSREAAEIWFRSPLQPQGWEVPPPWDPISGDYRAADGWIRLHCNAPAHRRAALEVLGVAEDRDAVAAAVAPLAAEQLEAAIVGAGGAAAAMRTAEDWAAHPQGAAVAREPLVHSTTSSAQASATWQPGAGRPLAGLRVLDLTRVLAGPTATQALAGWGADVLRIDPPEWDEPGVVPLVTSGKRTARLDARTPQGQERLHQLVRETDVLVHGYRPGAMESLGLDEDARAALNPILVDVQLDAYGYSGPWRHRRGFDSLVQMSAGIADTGMRDAGAAKPTPLPVQALDYATGWLAAAATIRAIGRRREHQVGTRVRLSLARTARLLEDACAQAPAEPSGVQPTIPRSAPFSTAWGDALLTEPPVVVGDIRLHWDRGPQPLGSDAAAWAQP